MSNVKNIVLDAEETAFDMMRDGLTRDEIVPMISSEYGEDVANKVAATFTKMDEDV
jgi:hypothetical protein